MSLLGGEEDFDGYDDFVRGNIPETGGFLRGQDVLEGDEHVEFHRTTRDIFEERKVYDMTFNYNLTRLNLDSRHPDAGYRYAEDTEDDGVLRAEFTPTTEFCPQSHTLAIGSFRAWNGLSDRHGYDEVRVRVDDHQNSDDINERMREIEERYGGEDVDAVNAAGGDVSSSDGRWAEGP
ncbi:MAG: hypothetical protein ACI9QA_000122 [Methanobacteriota archaeon]|jgi:hypothetical protein